MTRLLPASIALGILAAGGAVASGRGQAPATPSPSADYTRDIRPLLETHCYECHGPKKRRGRLRLDLRAAALKGGMSGAAIVPGDAENSQLIRRVLGLDGEDQMPLDKDPLSSDQIERLQTWIAAGAPWPDAAGSSQPSNSTERSDFEHWAYRQPPRPTPPVVSHASWARNAIDQFVAARLEKEGLDPSPEAPREALLRRVSLDLTGLPPSPDEIDAFLNDTRPDAYELVVDRLLASPHYGERWARPWLDLARYADSHGYEKDDLRTMWKYRDWVIRALNDDMPFDRFTIEQIAGDMLQGATPDQIVASGFHRNTLLNQEGGIDVEEARWETLVDRVNTTATVWLGSTIACAQCHNHKYDPFSQRDYYRLLAFFDNVEYSVHGKPGGDHWIREPELDLPTPEQAERRTALAAELASLKEKLTDANPEIDGAQPAWEKAMLASDETWTVLEPRSARANAASLTVQTDSSVLASGKHSGSDTYVVEAMLQTPRITGIRLEALPDRSLPKGGPGRDHYGNFVLTAFLVEVIPPAGAPRPITFAEGAADDSAGSDIEDLIRGKAPSRADDLPPGWSIDASRDESRFRRQAVFVPESPVDVSTGSRVKVTLGFRGGNVGQALGRFRLSATSAEEPLELVRLKAKTRAWLTIPEADRSREQLETIRTEYRSLVSTLAPVRERIEALEKELESLGIVTALVMKERPSSERPSTPFRERGAFTSPGDRMYAATPAVLPPLADDQMPNRLGLARWLVSEDNPLTARVTVNRAWEQFFGRGIVETSEDFGTQGALPSHPELLDWLATEFVRLKWSQKALHRLIVTSATYRQDAKISPSLLEKDPSNRLLARGPRFRMEAEMIRDLALAASGLLSREIGGPSVYPPQPEGIWDNPYSEARWETSTDPDRYRRAIYVFLRRTSPYPSLTTFDATSREFCTVRRVRTNTPLQALTMLNDEAFFEAARALAERVGRETPVDPKASPREQVRARAAYAFRLCTARKPNEPEIDAIVKSYERQRAHYQRRPAEAARVIDGPPGVPEADPIDLAAWTMVANSLLNLDETISK